LLTHFVHIDQRRHFSSLRGISSFERIIMKKAFCFSVALGLLLIASLAHAQSPSIFVDQMQPVIDETVGPLAIGGASEQQLAQTVTVARGGHLRGVFLPIGCDS